MAETLAQISTRTGIINPVILRSIQNTQIAAEPPPPTTTEAVIQALREAEAAIAPPPPPVVEPVIAPPPPAPAPVYIPPSPPPVPTPVVSPWQPSPIPGVEITAAGSVRVVDESLLPEGVTITPSGTLYISGIGDTRITPAGVAQVETIEPEAQQAVTALGVSVVVPEAFVEGPGIAPPPPPPPEQVEPLSEISARTGITDPVLLRSIQEQEVVEPTTIPTTQQIEEIAVKQQAAYETLALAVGESFPELAEAVGGAFPGRSVGETILFAQREPEAFLVDIKALGNTAEAQALLTVMFPTITPAQADWMFMSKRERWDHLQGYKAIGGRDVLNPDTGEWEYRSADEVMRESIRTHLFPDITEEELDSLVEAMGPRAEVPRRLAIFPEFLGSFVAGIGDVLTAAGGATEWFGATGAGTQLAEPLTAYLPEGTYEERLAQLGGVLTGAGGELQEYAPPGTYGEFSWEYLYSPQWWASPAGATTLIGRALPFTLSLIIPSILTGGAATTLVAGTFAKLAVGSLVGGTTSRVLESAMEAGMTMDEALAKGLSPEEAKRAADEVFRQNLTLAGVDIGQFLTAFVPTPLKAPSLLVRTAMVAGKIAVVGLTEAGEEAYQEVVQRQALGETIELDAEMQQVMAVGGLMGMGFGGAGGVYTAIQTQTIKNLPADLRLTFDSSLMDFQAQGLTLEQAQIGALDVIAETPEGQAAVEQAVETVKHQEAVKEIEPKTEVDRVVIEHQLGEKLPAPEVAPIVVPEVAAIPEVVAPVEGVMSYEERLVEASRLEQENRAILATPSPSAGEISPAQLGMMSKTQHAKYMENLAEKIEIESQIKALRRTDEEIARVEKIRVDKETSGRIAQLQRQIADLESVGISATTGKMRPTYQRAIETAEAELRALEVRAELAGAETVSTEQQVVIDEIESLRSEVAIVEGEGVSTQTLDTLAAELKAGTRSIAETDVLVSRERIAKLQEHYQKRITSYEVTRQALTDYVNKSLPVAERGKTLAAIKNVKTEAGLQKAIARVDGIAELNTQKVLSQEIDKELKKIAPKKVAGIPRGKFVPETQRLLDAVKTNLHVDRDGARERMAKNIEDYEAGKLVWEEMVEANNLLDLAGIQGMDSTELRGVLDEVRSIKAIGKFSRQEIREEFSNRMSSNREQFIGEITGGKTTVAQLSTQDKAMRTSRIRQLAYQQLALDDLLNELSKFSKVAPFESELSKWGNNIHRAREKENAGIDERKAEFWQAAKDTLGVPQKRWWFSGLNAQLNKISTEEVDLGTFKNLDGVEVNLKYTKGQLISAYQAIQDPTLDTTFSDGMRWTEEMRQAVANSLTQEEKAWSDWMMSFYQRYWTPINEVYERTYFTSLGHNRNYSPISREVEPRTPEPILFMREAQRYSSTANRSLKARVSTKKPLRFHDANKVLVNHMTQMEHFMAFTDTIKEWRSVFMNPDVRNAIRQFHGNNILKLIDSYIEDLARSGIDRAKTNWLLDTLRRNFTLSILAIKPAIAIKQLPSTLAYSTQMPIADYFSGVVDFWANPIEHHNFLRDNSATLKRRWGGMMERDIGFALQKKPTAQISQTATFKDKFMLPIRMMDKFATVQGSWAKYRSELAILEKTRPDLTAEERTAEAVLSAAIVTERTQPSFNIESLSSLQKGGAAWKLLTMFQNQPNKYWRIYYNNTMALVYGRGSRGKAGYNLFLAWVVLPMIFQFMADAFQWKPERQLRAALFGPANFLLVGGQLFQTMYGWATGMPFDYQASPVISTFDEIQKAFSKAKKLMGQADDPYKNIDMDDVWAMIEYLGKAAGQLLGYPTPWIVQAERGLRAGDPMTLIFSQWAMQPPDKSMYRNAEDDWLQIGETLPLEEGQFEAEIYDALDYFRDARDLMKKTLPSDVIGDKGAPDEMRAVAEALELLATYNYLPDSPLYKINTDLDDDWTIIDYYKQWQAREKIDNLADLKEFDKIYPNANRGNVSRREYEVLVGYLNAEDKDAFLEEHPELKVDPQVEWLKANPEENAKLALWGQAKILTEEAYDAVQKLIRDLDIPNSAILDYLPPEGAVSEYFAYQDAVAEFGANSAEAKLIVAGSDILREYLERQEIETPIQALEISAEWRDMDEQYELAENTDAFLAENPEYHAARRERDAYNIGFTESLIPQYVDWYTTEKTGYEGDWYLIENQDFYNEMIRLELWKELDFGNVPTRSIAALLDEREAMRLEDGRADTQARKEFEALFPELDAFMHIVYGNKLEETTDLASVDISKIFAMPEAVTMPTPTPEPEPTPTPTPPPPGWTDEDQKRWGDAQTHGIEIDTPMMDSYVEYWRQEQGKDRLIYRHNNPEFDKWLMDTFGYTPVGDRWKPEPEPTPKPTPTPTLEPTPKPTLEPTPEPTVAPTPEPTPIPTPEPTPTPPPEGWTEEDQGRWEDAKTHGLEPDTPLMDSYVGYWRLPIGKDRLVYRHENPEFDKWLMDNFGYAPVGDRWKPTPTPTPTPEPTPVPTPEPTPVPTPVPTPEPTPTPSPTPPPEGWTEADQQRWKDAQTHGLEIDTPMMDTYVEYWRVPVGKARLIYRHENPEFEKWLVETFGYTPVGDRWE